MNPIITFILMGVLTYFEVTWIEPERLSTLGIIAAVLVISGAIMAVAFAKQIIELADDEYTCIGTHKWFCERKNEYVEIKKL